MKGVGALLAVASAVSVSATELGSPFTDGAVLQRDREVPVWGWAKPGETVVVGFAGQRVEATAGADGKWAVKLAPMSASSESRVLTANEAKAEDVLVGEVWICSGQSNMDCPIWGANPRYRDGMGLVELRKTVHPTVRCAKVRAPRGLKSWSVVPRDRADVAWERMTPAMLEAYCGRAEWETPVSAVGWYFVRELHRSLGIPIGLVDASVGGVNIGTWTPRSGYGGHPELKELADWCSVPDEEWKTEMAKGAVNGAEKQPSALFNGLVSPLVPMAMRGLLWYQGCSNAEHDPAEVYCIKMHALYDGWSREFANPGLKLYFAQLAPCNDVSSIQLGQARFAAEEPNSGMAVINDVGNLRDIHPNDKRTVATRLALHALRNDYGFKDVIAEAPVFDTAVAEGETVTVRFKGVERGFYIYNDDRSLRTGFELAGSDGVFKAADVTNLVTTVHTNGKRRNGVLSGRDIVLRAEGVKSPTAVRYLFAKPWRGSVYSSDSGLPLGVFEGKVERRELADGGSCLGVREASYLKRKWRTDVSDRSTGMDAAAIRRALESSVSDWSRTESWPMVKARMFEFCCRNIAIDVSPCDWFPAFALWTRHRDHPVLPFMEKRRDEIAARIAAGTRAHAWSDWCSYADFDHSAPDWDAIVGLGFTGMRNRLLANWKDTEYYRARRIAMDGVLLLLDRLVEKGEKTIAAGSGGETGIARARLRKQVDSLKRLRAGAPVTALDALNFIYLYWCMCEKFDGIQVRTLGNLDRLLTPYYRADLAAGRTGEAEFRDQLRHFWWQWGSIDNYWGQPVYFGGTEADGSSVYNEVSRSLLDVHDELALPTPKLHLKMGRSTPDWVWRKSLEMMRRQRPISFLGEESHARVIRSLGYSADEAREFAVWGCYEWAVKDSANDTFGASVNVLKPVATLLGRAADGAFAARDFASFKAAYFAEALTNVVHARDFALANETHLWEINPAMLPSVATEFSVKTGRDAYQGGTAHGNNTGIWMIGLGSAVDALLAVDEIVYAKREMSLAGLGRLMADDWAGREDLRQRMLRSKRKWGNDDPEANALCVELVKTLTAPVNRRPNSRGGVFKAHGHTARYHIDMGRRTGATPDGRKKGEEMSKNISPTMGADTEGATALVNSAVRLDARDLPGDFPLDVALLPNTVAGEKGLVLMRTLIERYFAGGGLVIQFNIQDAATLRDAQNHPEKYENLQVRVCGWNVRWNDIPKVEQDKFILRQEAIAR